MDNNPIRFNDPKGDIIPIVWAIGEGIAYLIIVATAVDIAEEVIDASVNGDMTFDLGPGNSGFTKGLFDEVGFPSYNPEDWSTSRGNAENWPGSYTPTGGKGNPMSPGEGEGPNVAKWLIETGLAAEALKELYEVYGAKPPAKYDPESSLDISSTLEIKMNVGMSKNSDGSFNEKELVIVADLNYKIQSGDNLTKIAKDNHTTVEQLVEWNSIEDKNSINAGETIKVSEGISKVTL